MLAKEYKSEAISSLHDSIKTIEANSLCGLG